MNATILLLSGLVTVSLIGLATYLKFVSQNVLLGSLITFVGVFLVFSGVWSQLKDMLSTKEGMSNLSPGNYPDAETQLPLEPWYPANTPFHLSDLTYDTQWKDYPTYPARSMKTNLIKYWDNPSNGTCAPAELCGAFYKKIVPGHFKHSDPPAWGSGIRVNFYDTCLKN